MPTEEARRTKKLKLWIGVLVTLGLLYVSASVLVMNHLVQENNTFCAQRQDARHTIRYFIETKSLTWTEQDQKILDDGLAELVSC